MKDPILFYSVFGAQVLLLSVIVPGVVVRRARRVLHDHPEADYPKLYPVPAPVIASKLTGYGYFNLIVALVGLVLLVLGLRDPHAEMLGWDNQAVLLLFFALQALPLLLAEFRGFAYFRLMRRVDTRTRRAASLVPRRFLDYAPPVLVWAAVAVYLAFVVLVVVLRQHPFPGFAGYGNLVGATLLNLVYGASMYFQVHGKKVDPHQTPEDRHRKISLSVKSLLLLSIVGTLFLGLFLILGALGKRFLIDIAIMVFLQVGGLVTLYMTRVEAGNFDVYRASEAAGD